MTAWTHNLLNPIRLTSLALMGCLVVAGCSGSDGSAEAGDSEVTIALSRFDPKQITVDAGGVVRFVNTDPFAHTVTATDESTVEFDSGDMGEDDVFEVAFDEPGTFSFFCEIHPTMRGEIVVG